jgi:hypothetical protein
MTSVNSGGPAAIRWTAGRKQKVLYAIARGVLTPGEAMIRYGLSREELEEWQRRYGQGDDLGRGALRATNRDVLAGRAGHNL